MSIELQSIITEIKNEIKVNSNGQAFISKRGLARLLGISDANFNAQQMSKKLAKTLTKYGFDVAEMNNGVPDLAIPYIAYYYANEAKEKSNLAGQVLLAFSAIGARTWFQQIIGYEEPKKEITKDTASRLEELKILAKSTEELIKLYEYSSDKPGLSNIFDYARMSEEQAKLNGLVHIDEILDRLGKEVTVDEKRIIGMFAATQYRNLTGKKPYVVQKRYIQENGRKQYPLISAYPADFVPVIENAIKFGLVSTQA